MDDEADTPETEREDDDVLERALRRFDECAVPQLEMRAQSLAARRFAFIPGAQWEGDIGDAFENSIKLEIPKIAKGLDKIESDYRQNRVVPDFRPSGGDSDDDSAETLDGIWRADNARCGGDDARDNAFIEAIGGGFGAYRLCNDYEDEYDPKNDAQRIKVQMIADADQCVFFDHQARAYDKNDARFAFVITEFTPDAFADEYGDERMTDWPDAKIGENWDYDWFEPEVVRVAEYYEKQDATETMHVFRNGLTGEEERFWDSEIDDEQKATLIANGWTHTRLRRKRCRIMKWVLSGAEVLDGPTRIPGRRIPIVPVYGKRWFIEGMERFKGHVQDRMDVQRLYNIACSRVAEAGAQGTSSTPIFAPEQMEGGLGDIWANRAIDRPAYLLANPLADPLTGGILSAGPTGMLEPPTLGPVDASLIQIAKADLIEADQDGAEQVKANVSAEAMDIAATRVDARSGIYLDNFRKSVKAEGEIYLGMVPEIYAEPGREVETMDQDGGDGKAVLYQVYTDASGAMKTRNDFARGGYKVMASVAEATATRRDKTVRASLNIAEVALKAGDPETAQAAILTAISNTDGEGITELKDFARRKGLNLGLFQPNEDEAQMLSEASQQPDPNAALADAQANALNSQAARNIAQAGKAEADAGLAEAKTIETLNKIGMEPEPTIRRASELGGPFLQ
ncbi:Phage P22-like portal protein [uncultured Caudovirales phage]|uniref:Phage P22-like portal protein n=1 Tax=uncultured Caudovirales phage TaxID=2100421 RepID=A0A6J5M0S8_9CAUD|nr:Phage P22-like portal protein [uncultured Caudovirales phage]